MKSWLRNVVALAGLLGGVNAAGQTDEAVQAAKAWLAAGPADRPRHEPLLRAFQGDIDEVIARVRPAGNQTRTGEFYHQSFTVPELKKKHSSHQFHFVVPPFYRAGAPIGLFIWLHGGGSYEPSEIDHLAEFDAGKKSLPRPALDKAPFIALYPIAPFGDHLPGDPTDPEKTARFRAIHASRWDVPGADEYLMDLITEMSARYHIDFNRVVIAGFSMGGIGVYHQCQRLNDRIAAAYASAGSWQLGAWKAMKHTPLFIHHGATDSYWNSPDDYRWHGTDVAYARLADQILTGLGFEHKYWEFPGGHRGDDLAEAGWIEFVSDTRGWILDKVRDPYPRDLVAVTPRTSYEQGDNYNLIYRENPSPHMWWVSIDAIGPGTIRYDWARTEGSGKYTTRAEWADFRVTRSEKWLTGGEVDARWTAPNTVELTTRNVTQLTLWLHPKLADLRKPVKVVLNGSLRQVSCTPSLLDALRSYERRRDWGAIYHGQVTLNSEP